MSGQRRFVAYAYSDSRLAERAEVADARRALREAGCEVETWNVPFGVPGRRPRYAFQNDAPLQLVDGKMLLIKPRKRMRHPEIDQILAMHIPDNTTYVLREATTYQGKK